MSLINAIRSPGHPLRIAVIMLGIAVLSFAADLALNNYAFGDAWTILWPLNGFTVAALLMLPRSRWLAVMVAVALGTYLGEIREPANGWLDQIWIRCMSVTEVLLTAFLLPPFVSLEDWLTQPNIFRRLMCAFTAGTGVSGLMAMFYYHAVHGETYLEAFSGWGPADGLGLAMVIPLVFALRSSEVRRLFRLHRLRRTLGILALAFSSSALIFYESRYPIIFVLYPVLLLVDLTLGFAGSALTVSWACMIAVWMTTNGEGPFANLDGSVLSSKIALQVYLSFHILILFPASILFLERKRVNRQLRQAYSQMSRLATIDQLTGIANRRTLDIAIVQEWSRSLREGQNLAILMVDLDHFKEYNDSLGHQAGDSCLTAVAQAIASQAIRPGDIAARYGGEEFAVLLPNTTPCGAQSVATKVVEAVAKLQCAHPSKGTVTVSVGCAVLTPSASNSSTLLVGLADQALYQAKKAGRNRAHSIMGADQDLLAV